MNIATMPHSRQRRPHSQRSATGRHGTGIATASSGPSAKSIGADAALINTLETFRKKRNVTGYYIGEGKSANGLRVSLLNDAGGRT